MRAAQRGVIKRLAGAQAVALKLADLVGLPQGAQHAEGGARADVGADAHPHPVLPAGGQAKQPAAEKQVRGGAKRHRRTGVMQALPLAVVKVNRVGKHAALAGQAVVVIHVQIALVLRPEVAHPGHFVGIFAQVGLHPGIRELFSEQADRGEQLGG